MSSDTKHLRITLVRSVIGSKQKARATVEALGLRKVNTSVTHKETPQILGMINRVSHLLSVEEVEVEDA